MYLSGELEIICQATHFVHEILNHMFENCVRFNHAFMKVHLVLHQRLPSLVMNIVELFRQLSDCLMKFRFGNACTFKLGSDYTNFVEKLVALFRKLINGSKRSEIERDLIRLNSTLPTFALESEFSSFRP